ncbi:MAG: hypothetical protein ABSG82_07885 [Sedimentisphaerales bacterium]|jgi:hypothetical protein
MTNDMEFEFEDKPMPEDGREKMSQEPRMSNLVDTTDCLEAVSVIKCWKNFIFIVVLVALLLLQGLFWMMNLKLVKPDEAGPATELLGLVAEVNNPASAAATQAGKSKQSSKQAGRDVNTAADANQPQQVQFRFWFEPTVKHVTAVVSFLNFVLIPSAVLYCLTMLFSLKISLIGRLGGINHIARAFFISLVFIVLLMPWQLLFLPVFGGAMFTPSELTAACQAPKTDAAMISFYLRFTGYWLLVVLLLLAAQIRSMRWAKMTLRRLEVI